MHVGHAAMMEIRRLDPAEWESFRGWYRARGDDLPPSDMAPLQSGYVAADERGAVGVGFLILTNSKMALMEFMQTNQDRSEIDQARALTRLAHFIEDTAQKLGFRVILGFVPEDHDTLARFYFRQGAVRAKKLMRLFYKGLRGED